MPNLSGNPALDVLFGLSFLYFLLSIVCSSVNEGIAVALRLRAQTLEHGIRSLLGEGDGTGDPVVRFYDDPRIKALMKPGKTRKPSYMPSRVFVLTLLDTFAPPPAGDPHSRDLIARANAAIAGGNLKQPLKGYLLDAVAEAGTDEARFRQEVERPFDEVMDRASGWYKRRVQIIMFCIAVVLAVAVNADTFAIGQRLWNDDALRAAVVAQVDKSVAGSTSGTAVCAKPGASSTPVDVAAACVAEVKQLKLPVGWSVAPHGWRGYGSKLIGLLITAFALTLGAPFWFDLLGKVAQLRGSGPAPPGSAAKSA